MDITIFFLVLIAAFFHAVWNFAAKKASGDLTALWLALSVSIVVTVPFAWYVGMPDEVLPLQIWLLVGISGFFLGIYFLFLGKAYELADISFVYPLSAISFCAEAETTIFQHLAEI